MKSDKILLSHGSGGRISHQLVKEIFVSAFSNPVLDRLDDQAIFETTGQRIAFTTDSYVIDPIFFPGGDIGKLAVCGTVNDLAMSGAVPRYLSAGFIIEEGFPVDDLRRVVQSMSETAREAGVTIVTGDTKVVSRGQADKLFINTAGVGFIDNDINISGSMAKPGDKIIISGTIGDHGIAVLSKREGLEFDFPIISDCAPLNSLVSHMLSVTKDIHVLRDPTRGGVATILNEIAQQSNAGIMIEESNLPIREAVRGASEFLGYDPLYIANEGKLVAIVPRETADSILEKMRKNKYGKDAEIIGEVISEPKRVLLKTVIGGTRIVDMLAGELLPRIC
ncbi:hydrogenase expression/formation protein HypE [Candidatus Poribacteria bacterium]|nr:hydrogenase expression/formation protein HypE [Candidatus Poribacteria bacterium]